MDIKELITIPILAKLPQIELENLLSLTQERRAKKGAIVISAEDSTRALMFVLEGELKVSLISKEGKEVLLARLESGDFFGEIAVLTQSKRSANVSAISDCRFLVLSEENFYSHISKYTALSQVMLKTLAERLKVASGKIADLALYDVYRRIARMLKAQGEKEIREGKEIYLLSPRPTHQEISELVGTSREMVTRALKGLEEDACIEILPKSIIIKKIPI